MQTSGIRTSTMRQKRGKSTNPSTEVVAQILGHMGIEMKKHKIDGNQLPKSVTEKWNHTG